MLSSSYHRGGEALPSMDPQPGHGPREPTLTTPVRVAGSARRTSTMDCQWPDGLNGDVMVFGEARDLLTAGDGSGHTVGTASLRAHIAFQAGREILALSSDPHDEGLSSLLGL